MTAARSNSRFSEASAISASSRLTIFVVRPAMKSQNSSAISRWASGVIRPTHGAEHLPM